jgi:hypothetical protein
MSISRILSSRGIAAAERQSFISSRFCKRTQAAYPFRVRACGVEWASLLSNAALPLRGKRETYVALLPVGFVLPSPSLAKRCALTLRTLHRIPHLFTLIPNKRDGIFSVTLSVRFLFLDVIQHRAQSAVSADRSSDFPPPSAEADERDCLTYDRLPLAIDRFRARQI